MCVYIGNIPMYVIVIVIIIIITSINRLLLAELPKS